MGSKKGPFLALFGTLSGGPFLALFGHFAPPGEGPGEAPGEGPGGARGEPGGSPGRVPGGSWGRSGEAKKGQKGLPGEGPGRGKIGVFGQFWPVLGGGPKRSKKGQKTPKSDTITFGTQISSRPLSTI